MRIGLPLFAVFLLSGCAAVLDQDPPRSLIDSRAETVGGFVGQTSIATTSEDLPSHWWKLYGDARLEAYVEEALAANTDLRVADANLRRAKAIMDEARAATTLRTSTSGQALGSSSVGFADGLSGGVSYSLGVDGSYMPDVDGRLRRGIEAASAQSEATQAARDQIRVSLTSSVTRQYARVCTASVSLIAARRVAQIQQSTLQVAERMSRGGRGTRFDVDRARAAALASEAAIPDILAERQAALFALAALMGRPPADYPPDALGCDAMPLVAQSIPVGDGSMLLRRRPDIRKAERDLVAATAATDMEKADLHPRVSFGFAAGTSGPLDDLFKSSVGFSLGPKLSWTFPNRRLVYARIEQADANAQRALGEFDGAILVALRQVESALAAYAGAQERLKSIEASAASAEKAADDAEALQRFGRAAFSDVLNVQASQAEAQASLYKARANLVDRQIDLFLALGGGWD